MDDYCPFLFTTAYISLALPTVFTACRLCERIKSGNLGMDDGCMVVAYLLTIACSVCVEEATVSGFGKHMTDVDGLHDRALTIRWAWIASLLSSWSSALARCSTLILLMRTLGDTLKQIQKFTAFAVMAVLCTGCLLWSCILLHYFVPAHAVWEMQQPREHVKPAELENVGMAVAACNALVDFFCSLALGCVVYGLQMEERQNALRKHRFLAILLGRGITQLSVSILKTASMSGISNVSDMTYSWSLFTIFSMTENTLTATIDSIPNIVRFCRSFKSSVSGPVTEV